MRWCWLAIKGMVAIVLYLVEGVFWLGQGMLQLCQLGSDVVKARQSLPGGVLHCPKGHPIETDTGAYQCTKCSFVSYTLGSIWLCRNPECQATTDFIGCPTCGLSVRSPYRFGGRP